MENNYTELLNKLYDEQYSGEKCTHYDECSKKCVYQLNFYRGRIGSNYGKGIPKIFIVGREPVFPKNYNGQKITYTVEEPCSLADAGYNSHYLRTFYTVAKLVLKDNFPRSFNKNDMKLFEDIRHCFFLTNFFKCVFTDDTGRSGKDVNDNMRKNCSKILLKEIEILKPDIIILQGKNYSGIWESINCDKEPLKECSVTVQYPNKKATYNQALYSATLNGHKFCVIDSYHPTSHGIWATKEVFEGFTDLLQKALDFCNEH